MMMIMIYSRYWWWGIDFCYGMSGSDDKLYWIIVIMTLLMNQKINIVLIIVINCISDYDNIYKGIFLKKEKTACCYFLKRDLLSISLILDACW